MADRALFSDDDLEALARTSFDVDEPRAVADELVKVAEQGRLVDPADAGYAYLLAAEVREECDEPASALALVERAATAFRTQGQEAYAWPPAYRARLLFRLGRAEEAMAELTALRPKLTSDELAVMCVSETLENADRPEIALDWLTGSLDELWRQHPDRVPDELTLVVFHLAVERHRLRRDLDLPHDDFDLLADAFLEAAEDGDDDEEWESFNDGEPPVLLWWPRQEYEQVATRWPDALEPVADESWDNQRRLRQRLITGWDERGLPAMSHVTGTADGFAAFLDAHGMEGDEDALDAYLTHLTDSGGAVRLPPGRNAPCWCGSAVKYKKCCLPLVRS